MTYVILFIIGLALFYGYGAWAFTVVGLRNLPSWSATYDELAKKKDWYKYVFQAVMIAMAFIYSIVLFEVTTGLWFQFLTAFTTIPIGFVGFAPNIAIGNVLERGVHINAAKISAVASLLLVCMLSIFVSWSIAITIPVSGIIAYLLYLEFGNHTKILFAEMACFWWTQATMAILLFKYLILKGLL